MESAVATLLMLNIFPALILVGVTDAQTNRTVQIYQSSVIDQFTADFAVDFTWTTCAVTGIELGAWWRIDFAETKLIRGVYLHGESFPLRVRVGFGVTDIGLRNGFEENAVCNDIYPGLVMGKPQTVYCHVPFVGAVLSITSVEKMAISQLRLCDVQIF